MVEYVVTDRLKVIPSCAEHAGNLAPKVREKDVAKIWASSRITPSEALLLGLERSAEAYSIIWDDSVVGMFGVIIDPEGHGIVWMLSSDQMKSIDRRWLKHSRLFVDVFVQTYGLLHNYVDSRYAEAIAWVKWCGFTLEEAAPYGPDGVPFHYFWKRGDC